jgi:galactitol-specific phosphotransferase system IIB component
MRLLVCGGRHFDDTDLMKQELSRLHAASPITVLIHGGHANLGTVLEPWARENLVHVVRYPANWQLLGKKAEAARNDFMLADSRPDRVLAFPGGRHTHDLIRKSAVAGIPVEKASGVAMEQDSPGAESEALDPDEDGLRAHMPAGARRFGIRRGRQPMTPASREEPLRVLTVCGVGMGSSLMLRMTAEDVFKRMGVNAKVEATDVSSARGMKADVIIGQGMHTDEFEGRAPIVVGITNFMDKDGIERQLTEAFHDHGWME